MSFILVDAHSKWPGVVKMSIGSTTTSHTIGALRQMFSRFGIPKQLVTDNGPQFTSNEFNRFCKRQGIRHTLSPPYHPRTNGQAERFVQSFKQAV
jgi:transposase InsO family protein